MMLDAMATAVASIARPTAMAITAMNDIGFPYDFLDNVRTWNQCDSLNPYLQTARRQDEITS
jgi:hypothetical protein